MTQQVEGSIVRQIAEDGEAGARYLVRCPECRQEIDCADAAWWDTRCACGIRWRVAAIGERDNA